MAGTPVRILLARHGETEWNVAGRWQGHADSPLTDRGVAQARALGEMLAAEPIAAVYSSDLGRALETARLVAAPHGLEPIAEPRMREINTGAWTTRYGREIKAEDPDLYDTWRSRPWSMRVPGGESLAEVQTRCLAFFAERMPRHAGETVVVISHGTITHAILAHAMRRPLTDIWLKEGHIENCQIARLEWTDADGLQLIEFGDTRHLAEVGSLGGWRTTEQPAPGHDEHPTLGRHEHPVAGQREPRAVPGGRGHADREAGRE